MERATIKDVAKLAGVSKATVSHVVNNTRFVEDGTRQRVLHIIDQLGYQPSLIARSLTTNQTKTIGVIVSDVSNIFFGDVLHGIEDITRPAGYRIVVCDTGEMDAFSGYQPSASATLVSSCDKSFREVWIILY